MPAIVHPFKLCAGMTTSVDVALWMVQQVQAKIEIEQEILANDIKKQFGAEYVSTTESGNLSINRNVLAEFKKLHEGTIVWEKGSKSWRKLSNNELEKIKTSK